MKRFLGYLYDCRYMWIWFILSGGAFVLCFALYEVELKAAVYPVLLSRGVWDSVFRFRVSETGEKVQTSFSDQ